MLRIRLFASDRGFYCVETSSPAHVVLRGAGAKTDRHYPCILAQRPRH